MSAMLFMPALCRECRRVVLVAPPSPSHPPRCAKCETFIQVLPSCSYSAKDVELFNDLSAVGSEARLTPGQALSHAHQVDRALQSGDYAATLESLSTRMPGHLPIQMAVGRNLTAQRRLLAMWRTILEGLSSAANQSGEYRAVGPRVAPSGSGT